MQHLWLTERIIDIVAHELGLDPVEMRKLNYVQPEEMPYETPNGCVYDSGDYPRALDIGARADRLRRDRGAARRREGARQAARASASARRSTRARTTSASRRSSTPTCSSRATTRSRRSSSTSSARSSSRSARRRRARATRRRPRRSSPTSSAARPTWSTSASATTSYWNSHAGFSGTYASQFAVTGPRRRQGRGGHARAARCASSPRSCSGAGADDDRARRRVRAGSRTNPEAALPFMALGAIVNANNAGLPEDLDADAELPLRLPAAVRGARHREEVRAT